jgi:hypothetical protein
MISALLNFAVELFFSPAALAARQKELNESGIREIANPADIM